MATYQRESESDKEMTASLRRHPPDDKNTNRDFKTPHEASDYFSSLPNELLVKIISLLPETHDRVKFQYISRRLQKISETPQVLYGAKSCGAIAVLVKKPNVCIM